MEAEEKPVAIKRDPADNPFTRARIARISEKVALSSRATKSSELRQASAVASRETGSVWIKILTEFEVIK